jgi:hypothetical protein
MLRRKKMPQQLKKLLIKFYLIFSFYNLISNKQAGTF